MISRILLACLIISGALFAEATESKPDFPPDPPRILMISPFNVSFVQHQQFNNSLLDQLTASGTSFSMDRLDLEYHYEGGFSLKKEELQIYSTQVKNGAYQIIICFGLPTLDFVEKHFTPIPPQTTMIVCNVPSPLAERIPRRKNVIGVIQKLDVHRNFYLINQLFPAKRKVILLTAWDENGRCFQEEARKAVKAYPSLELNVIDNKTVTTEEMLRQVASAASDTVVLFQGWYNKNAVNAASLQHLLNSLGNKVNVPLFVTHCTMVRYGTVGGDVECGEAQGKAVANLVRRILDGEKADGISRQTLPDKMMLNDAMLKFYQIPEEYIPAGAEIIGRAPTMWTVYKTEIITGGVVIVLLLIGAGVLWVRSTRYRNILSLATRIARESPVHIMIIDEQEDVYSYFIRKKLIAFEENLKDCHLDDYAQMHQIIQDTLQHGGHHTAEFVLNGVHRRGFLVRLSMKISGRAAVMLVDMEEQYYLMQEQQLLLTCLNAIMPNHEQKKSFETILKTFCEFFNGERSYLTHFDIKESYMEIVGEYHAPASRSIKQDFHKTPISTNEPWFTRLKSKHEPAYYDVENNINLDDCSVFWQKIMRQNGVTKMYSIPIRFQGKLWGCWSLIYKDKDIQPSHASLMRLIPQISNMIELVLFRQIYLSKLEDSQQKALVAVRTKSAFLATMSHELRTPLNAIIGFTELMEDRALPCEEQLEYIAGISHSSKALLALINNILDFSKLEAGSMKIVSAPLNLNVMLENLKKIFKQMAAKKGISLNFIVPDDLPVLIVDELRIKQILLNLLGNAIKYTNSGSISVTVLYRLNTLSIQVADTGIGIEKEVQKKIFEPFVQQDIIRDSKVYQGTGLGLTIARKLAECMGGQITLDSEIGKGSVFTLTLNNISAAAPDCEVQNIPNDTKSAAVHKNILLVNDVPINLKVLSAMFRKAGYSVMNAASGKEALAIIHSQPVDYVFTDMWMPEMNGKALADKIRSIPEFSKIRIVAVTADVTLDVQDSKFDAVLQKPVTLTSLNLILQKLAKLD